MLHFTSLLMIRLNKIKSAALELQHVLILAQLFKT